MPEPYGEYWIYDALDGSLRAADRLDRLAYPDGVNPAEVLDELLNEGE